MAPILAAKLFPAWNAPLDFERCYRGQRIFGSHKTIRGLLAGVSAGELAFLAVRNLMPVAMLPRADILNAPIYFGLWIGLSALLGDLGKSFLKRRFGIAPGKPWFPFDQVDWAISSVLGSLPFIPFTIFQAMAFVAVASALSLGARCIGFLIKVNETPI